MTTNPAASKLARARLGLMRREPLVPCERVDHRRDRVDVGGHDRDPRDPHAVGLREAAGTDAHARTGDQHPLRLHLDRASRQEGRRKPPGNVHGDGHVA